MLRRWYNDTSTIIVCTFNHIFTGIIADILNHSPSLVCETVGCRAEKNNAGTEVASHDESGESNPNPVIRALFTLLAMLPLHHIHLLFHGGVNSDVALLGAKTPRARKKRSPTPCNYVSQAY